MSFTANWDRCLCCQTSQQSKDTSQPSKEKCKSCLYSATAPSPSMRNIFHHLGVNATLRQSENQPFACRTSLISRLRRNDEHRGRREFVNQRDAMVTKIS